LRPRRAPRQPQDGPRNSLKTFSGGPDPLQKPHVHFSAAAVERSIERISDTEVGIKDDAFEDDFADNKERDDTRFAMEFVTFSAGCVALDVFKTFPQEE